MSKNNSIPISTGSIFTCPKDGTVKEYTTYETTLKNDSSRERFPCEKDCDIFDCPIRQ